jgi:hypothetical protein
MTWAIVVVSLMLARFTDDDYTKWRKPIGWFDGQGFTYRVIAMGTPFESNYISDQEEPRSRFQLKININRRITTWQLIKSDLSMKQKA